MTEVVAVKYGEQSLVEDEARRYRTFVEPLADDAATRLRAISRQEWRAAISYSLVGGGRRKEEVEDFGSLCEHLNDPTTLHRLEGLVPRLFNAHLAPWHQCARSDGARRHMRDYYFGGAGLQAPSRSGLWQSPEEAERAIGQVVELSVAAENELGGYGVGVERDGAGLLRFRWLAGSRALPDPTVGVLEHRGPQLLCVWPVHGDLHVRNILVCDENPRLIDFGRTDWGHCFADFAALETSLRFTRVASQEAGDLVYLEEALAGATQLGGYIDLAGAGDPCVTGTLQLTRQIRFAARQAVSTASRAEQQRNAWLGTAHPIRWPGEGELLQQYLYAVMYYALRYAGPGYPDEDETNEAASALRRWRALFCAALIWGRLSDRTPENSMQRPAQQWVPPST